MHHPTAVITVISSRVGFQAHQSYVLYRLCLQWRNRPLKIDNLFEV